MNRYRATFRFGPPGSATTSVTFYCSRPAFATDYAWQWLYNSAAANNRVLPSAIVLDRIEVIS